MKTSFKTLMCALVLGSTAVFAGPGKGTSKPTTFATGIYKTTKGDLSVNIEKKGVAPVTVLILNSKGEVLSREGLTRKQTKATIRFDVSNLQDGEYQVKVVSNGEKEVTDFSITSQASVVARTITLE